MWKIGHNSKRCPIIIRTRQQEVQEQEIGIEGLSGEPSNVTDASIPIVHLCLLLLFFLDNELVKFSKKEQLNIFLIAGFKYC